MKHANVALFVPNNGCPHRCSFCNQHSITGQQTQPGPQDVVNAVRVTRESLGAGTKQAEIAFFGGSFTAVERGYMCSLLEAAAPFVRDGTFAGIRLSTRPDAVDEEVLGLLKTYGVTAVELGAQSMDDRVLRLNRRGHTAEQVEKASGLVKAFGFSLGLQMMTGLYGDTPEGAAATARRIAALRPETVRIYPAIVLRGTELGEKYLAGEFQPPTLEDTVRLCAELLDYFEEQGISVIRLGLHSSPELERDRLAGPWHPAFRQLCESRRLLQRMTTFLTAQNTPKGKLTVAVAPRQVSTAVGQRRANLTELRKLGYEVCIVPDSSVKENDFTVTLQRTVNPCC